MSMKTRQLYKSYPDLSRSDLDFLLCALFSCSRAELFKHKTLNQYERETIISWINRLQKGEPPQYITHKAWFYGLTLFVDSRVLIPRHDTEVIVFAILKLLKGSESLLEIGIGSGAISMALKSHFPQLVIHATDISAPALEVARKNLIRHKMQVELFHADLYPPEQFAYDLIISNPPYIPAQEYLQLENRVRDFEPRQALLADEDGLSVYKRILQRAPDYLKNGGILAFEHGDEQQKALLSLTESAGFKTLEKGKDLAMRDRFLLLKKI